MPIKFNLFKKKTQKPEISEPSRFPNKGKEIDWMNQKVAHVKATDPKNLPNLFSPATGDYMPLAVHVGSSWKRGSDVEDFHGMSSSSMLP